VDPTTQDTAVSRLLVEARQGRREALDQLLGLHRDYLRRIVDLRLDARLRGRIDSSDVVQEALLEAARRLPDYLAREPMPFRLWLRQTACQRLIDLRRQHLGAECRTAKREQALPATSSILLARAAIGGERPSQHIQEKELVGQVQRAMADLADDDAEIILLRNFEDLSNQEAAQVLGIDPSAASKRYGRALLRLRRILIESGAAGGSNAR